MPRYDYHLLDVFTDRAFGGNPLAVFPDAEGIDEALMQQLANELNLSETTFVLPPPDDTADFHVRIFTPAMELPMAGHPTVGTANALVRLGRIAAPGNVRFLEGVGVIPVSLSAEGTATMAQPMPTFGAVLEDRARVASLLSLNEDDLLDGYPVQIVSTGVPYIYIPLAGLEAAGRAKLRADVWAEHFAGQHIFTLTPETESADATVHTRMFAPAMGIAEDPATGAASGPLGAYLVQYGLADEGLIVNEQGIEMGRPSRIDITIERDGEAYTRVAVGGRSVYVGGGWFEL